MHTYVCACVCVCIYVNIYTCMYVCMYAYPHTHARARTHTHTQILSIAFSQSFEWQEDGSLCDPNKAHIPKCQQSRDLIEYTC